LRATVADWAALPSPASVICGKDEWTKENPTSWQRYRRVTLLFWIIKILATTLGETRGDAVTMSWLGETTAAAKGIG
jgi:hypothetical protein